MCNIKTKLAFIAPANSIHTVKWVNEMNTRDYDVTLFSLRAHQDISKSVSKGVHIEYLHFDPPFGYYLATHELKKKLEEGDFDVVNAHYATGYGTLARLSKAHPLLLNVWGSDVYDFPYRSYMNKILLQKNLNNADRIASTSEVMAEQIIRMSGIEKERITITPFGIDTIKFSPRHTHSFDRKCPIIGIIKTLEPQYGIDVLIKSIAELNKIIPQKVRLEIYGKGMQRESLETLSKELSLTEQIHFNGYVDHEKVSEILNSFDIFAVSSNSESFGVSLIEAMACEMPVVATDADGFKEIITDGEDGLLVECGDYRAMAKAFKLLITDENKRKCIGKKARENVIKRYTWKDNANIMDKMLESMSNCKTISKKQ